MVYQLFNNLAGIEKFENPEEEIEYYQDNTNNTEEEVIEYKTEYPEKVKKLVDEINSLKNESISELDNLEDNKNLVIFNEIDSLLKRLLEKIDKNELSSKEIDERYDELVELLNILKNSESSESNIFNDEEADDEGNDEEGGDAEDAFVETDDNSEVVEGFQGNNNVIEYNLGNRKLLSLDLLLRSVLYACLFYILAHPDTFKLVGKVLNKVSKSNLLYVHMAVFALVYYLLNLFI